MQLVRPFVLQTMIHTCNMQFKACHIQGKFNCKAEAISRKQFKTFKQLEPDADHQPMNIPKYFDLGNEVGRLIKSSITENTREVNKNGLNCFDPFRELWSRSRLATILISCSNFYFLSFIEQKIAYLSAITFPCKIEGFTNNLLSVQNVGGDEKSAQDSGYLFAHI